MSLEDYKLDKAFTEGVEIYLDEDTVFLVKLPSQYNRAYTQAQYEGIEMEMSDDGTVRTNGTAKQLLIARYAQQDAFVNHCIVSINGEPVPKNFAEEYPEPLEVIMQKAVELADDIENKVSRSVKKSVTLSSGKGSGQENRSSMASYKSEAV